MRVSGIFLAEGSWDESRKGKGVIEALEAHPSPFTQLSGLGESSPEEDLVQELCIYGIWQGTTDHRQQR